MRVVRQARRRTGSDDVRRARMATAVTSMGQLRRRSSEKLIDLNFTEYEV